MIGAQQHSNIYRQSWMYQCWSSGRPFFKLLMWWCWPTHGMGCEKLWVTPEKESGYWICCAKEKKWLVNLDTEIYTDNHECYQFLFRVGRLFEHIYVIDAAPTHDKYCEKLWVSPENECIIHILWEERKTMVQSQWSPIKAQEGTWHYHQHNVTWQDLFGLLQLSTNMPCEMRCHFCSQMWALVRTFKWLRQIELSPHMACAMRSCVF